MACTQADADATQSATTGPRRIAYAPGFLAHALHQPAAAMCLRPNIAQPPHSSAAPPWKNEQFAQCCAAVWFG